MRKIVSLCLSIIFIVSTSSYSFADTNLDNPPIEPTKPKVENYQDNDKIKEYNKEAEEYNKKVDEYNVAVDDEYNNAKEEIDKQNSEGQIKQETSQKAHDEAVATNEAEQERVDNINKQIDEDNAAEEQRVIEHNANEDALVEQNKQDIKNAKEENANREAQYNADVAQYEANMTQYLLDYKQYEKDKQEVDTYNAAVKEYNTKAEKYNQQVDAYNTYYQTLINNYIELNTNAINGIENIIIDEEKLPNTNSIDENIKLTINPKTISVNEATEKANETYKIMVQHIYRDEDLFIGKWEVVEADLNDIVTIIPEKTILTPNNGTILTYYYTDNNHLKGYWVPTITFESAAQTKNDISVIGNDTYQGPIYRFSYADGSVHVSGDLKDIILVYEYSYMEPYSWFTPYSKREYRNYIDEPIPPNEPEPVAAPEYIKVPNVYNPKYEEFVLIPYINPTFVEVPEVFIWENLPDPIKREYLNYASLLNLFATPALTPINKETPINTSNSNVTTNQRNITQFIPFGLGDGTESIESVEPIKKATITNNKAPLATTEGSWALINLIATLLVFLIAIILLMMAFVNKRKEDEELQIKNKMIGRIISIIVAVVTGFIFLITEDMSLPMVLVDKWTLLMIILLIVQLIIMILCKHKEIEKAS